MEVGIRGSLMGGVEQATSPSRTQLWHRVQAAWILILVIAGAGDNPRVPHMQGKSSTTEPPYPLYIPSRLALGLRRPITEGPRNGQRSTFQRSLHHHPRGLCWPLGPRWLRK